MPSVLAEPVVAPARPGLPLHIVDGGRTTSIISLIPCGFFPDVRNRRLSRSITSVWRNAHVAAIVLSEFFRDNQNRFNKVRDLVEDWAAPSFASAVSTFLGNARQQLETDLQA